MRKKNVKAINAKVKEARNNLISAFLVQNREYILVKAVEMWARKPFWSRLKTAVRIVRGARE